MDSALTIARLMEVFPFFLVGLDRVEERAVGVYPTDHPTLPLDA
jgi:hypothetical protein